MPVQARMVTLERDRLAAALHRKYNAKLPVDKLLSSLCTDLRLTAGAATALTNSLTQTNKVHSLRCSSVQAGLPRVTTA